MSHVLMHTRVNITNGEHIIEAIARLVLMLLRPNKLLWVATLVAVLLSVLVKLHFNIAL